LQGFNAVVKLVGKKMVSESEADGNIMAAIAPSCPNCDSLTKALILAEKLLLDSSVTTAATKCNFCDSTDGLEWHHIIPRSMGGTEDSFNLLLVCNVHHGILHSMKSRGNIGALTSAGLKRAKAKGVILGNKKNISEARVLASKANAEKADAFAARMRVPIERMLKAKMSMRAIAAEFNENGTKTARGGAWSACTVSNIMARWDVKG
jgi:hypothetical protein